MKRHIPMLLLAALLMGGCSAKQPAAVPVPQPQPEQPKPAAEAPAPAQAPPEKPGRVILNDEAEKLIAEKKWAEAIKAAEKAVEADKAGARPWWNLGRAKLGAGRTQEALSDLLKAQSLYPDFVPEIAYSLGQAYEALGHTGKAALYYKPLEDLNTTEPQGKEMREALGRLKARFAPAPVPEWYLDLTDDRLPERIDTANRQFKLSGPKGVVLYEASYPHSPEFKVEVVRAPGPPQQVRILNLACPDAAEDLVLVVDPSGKVTPLAPSKKCP